jgi:polar amino acid transport system substrate-binding protein
MPKTTTLRRCAAVKTLGLVGVLAVLCAGSVAASQHAASARGRDLSSIHVHTEAWADYTNKDGTGFAWDIIRAVFVPAGVHLEADYVPYSRAVQNVVAGTADAWIGSYADERSAALYPKWFYDADRVQALFLKRGLPDWDGPESLKNGPVGWVRGYEYDSYLDVAVKPALLKGRSRVFELLTAGRIRYWLDAAYEIDHLMEARGQSADLARFVRRPVMDQKLYVAFSDTPRGRRLREVWDQRFPKLLRAGRIAKIYNRWDMSVWPFDLPRRR